jgi:putative FmdB family regulatory protein
MPVYEYRCASCHLRFENLGAMSARDEGAECPSCGRRAERLISSFAAVSMNGGEPASFGGGCCRGGAGGSCACRA